MLFFKRLFGLKTESEKQFESFVIASFIDQRFSDTQRDQLNEFRRRAIAEADDAGPILDKIEAIHFERLFDRLAADDKITRAENDQMEAAATFLQKHPSQFSFWKNGDYNLRRYRGHLSDGEIMAWPNSDVDIRMASGETFLFGAASHLIKKKRTTTRVNYSGFTYNVRIAKGLSYKIGTIKPQVVSEERMVSTDTGTIWISTDRIGFRGSDKNIIVDLKKVAAIDIEDGFLKLFKTGKETPYLFHTLYLDTVCGVLSLALDGSYKLIKNDSAA